MKPTRPSVTPLRRRAFLLAAASTTLLSACASAPGSLSASATATASASASTPPIVFVHGNGDSAALWTTTLWRFESNGWPRERLFAVNLPYPLSRDLDGVAQAGRSSTADQLAALTTEIDTVLRRTGASQVVLMANSRGGNVVRNYIASVGSAVGAAAGAAKVSHAILGGTPNHGVFADAAVRPGNEFNGAGPFLMGLNAPKGPNGDEVTPGPKWLTIRSDNNDKFAQADGVWLGTKGTPTHVTADGPALRGAENVVIAGIDHRETAYGEKAFEQALRFITGKPPLTLAITPETRVVLDGLVAGFGIDNQQGTAPSNLPLVGATVEVYATDASTGARLGAALHTRTIGADGRWGPFNADPQARYEFVAAAPGYATVHTYRSPFPRSSSVVGLRIERLLDADKTAASVVTLSRPRGYFGVPRDRISLDGQSPPASLPVGTAGVATAKLKLSEGAGRAVVGEFNGERIVGRAWPTVENRMVVLELHQ